MKEDLTMKIVELSQKHSYLNVAKILNISKFEVIRIITKYKLKVMEGE